MMKYITFLSMFVSFFFYPSSVFAHSFGRLYNLPVPFWMYLYGGATAIIVSFLIVGYFFNKEQIKTKYKTIDLTRWAFFRIFTSSNIIFMGQLFSVFLFFLVILAGFIGRNLSVVNINMTLFWIIFVLGLTYLTALVGDIYARISPFRVISEGIEKFSRKKISGIFPYPTFLGYYPALLFYFFFIWSELFGATTPFTLSLLLVIYTFFMSVGIVLYGKESWLTYGEFFGVFFRLIGKMAPLENKKGTLYLRPPFVQLLKEKTKHGSLLFFVLFILSSTAFDSLNETTFWYRLYVEKGDVVLRPLLGVNSSLVFDTLGLLLSPFFFLSIYLLFIWLAKLATRSTISFKELSLQFAYSLLPIAFVYHVAHYYTLIITEGSNIVSLVSDPFGFGWNLFGTAQIKGIQVVDTNFVWHSQVALILLGHIIGVFLAHLIALQVFPTHKKALLSQFPMLILMVIYTLAGLWILSQPIAPGI